jgi:hypothetical protein
MKWRRTRRPPIHNKVTQKRWTQLQQDMATSEKKAKNAITHAKQRAGTKKERRVNWKTARRAAWREKKVQMLRDWKKNEDLAKDLIGSELNTWWKAEGRALFQQMQLQELRDWTKDQNLGMGLSASDLAKWWKTKGQHKWQVQKTLRGMKAREVNDLAGATLSSASSVQTSFAADDMAQQEAVKRASDDDTGHNAKRPCIVQKKAKKATPPSKRSTSPNEGYDNR